MSAPIPDLLRAEVDRLAAQGTRLDGRDQYEYRDITIQTGVLENAEGSAVVNLGGTIAYAGVKFEVRTPWPDRPTQGSLMCGAELRPVAHRKYEPGPPSPESIELGRVVDRGIRESGCLDMEGLCIIPAEKVWGIMIDLHILSDQGNIFDAAALAAAAALRTTIVPAARFDVGDDFELPLSKTPIMCSFTRAGGRYVLDASEKEELAGDERIHITLGDDGHVHSLQKGLKGRFTAAEFAEIMAQAQDHTKVLRSKVLQAEGS